MNSSTEPTSALTRRTFLRTSAVAVAASRMALGQTFAATAAMARHLPARVISAPDIPLPAGKREPFGWKTAAIGAVPLVLAWPDFPADAKPTAMRLTVGLDVRDEKLI